ncbi:DUF1214 domain-containing protein [Cupriavidus sp. NPDC089707]|uniref:DUF1214 domain-containing protein n=1 Tax=Cupriavidus sp. NPDC089707 TaxID=3363963 RepID=UPI0038107C73
MADQGRRAQFRRADHVLLCRDGEHPSNGRGHARGWVTNASANLDANGQAFDGAKTYRLRVPANVPVKDFWSVVLYDTQTRSMLQTDQRFPSLSSRTKPKTNPDGSVDVYFSPKRPANADNWVQTVPGKSWFTIFRLYGPLQPWFDKTWKLPDIQRVG